ncbi:MAG TPA: contractile injection system tape measure protein [Bacillota bacterium]|nr:contractile injection system tape measure protein [Bacillota bacterium]
MTQNHIIKKQVLEITLDSEIGSFGFQNKISELFKTEIVPLIDAYLSELSPDQEVLRIDKLEIDLGKIDRRNFDREFSEKFARVFPQKLAAAVRENLVEYPADVPGADLEAGTAVTEAIREVELLEYFLKNGRLPWWVGNGEIYDIPALLELYVTGQPFEMKRLIAAIAGDSGQLKRLVYHAGDPVLEKTVALFQPQASLALCQLTGALIDIFKECPLLISFGPSKVKPEVWAGMLSMAVVFEGSEVNRILILRTIAAGIAKTAGVDSTALYQYLTRELKAKGYEVTGIGARMEPEISDSITQIPSTGETDLKAEKLPLSEATTPKTTEFEGEEDPVSPERTVSEGLLETVARNKGLERARKIVPPEIVTFGTEEYIRQLEAVEKLLQEFQERLAGLTTGPGVPWMAGERLAQLSAQLPSIIIAIRNMVSKLRSLRRETATEEVFRLRLAEAVPEFKKEASQFGERLAKLHTDLMVALDPNLPEAAREFIQKILKSLEQIEPTTRGPLGWQAAEATVTFTDSQEIYVHNAGLVILWPYLGRFLETLGLVVNQQFVDEDARARAVFLLHYLSFGTEEIAEYESMLNKILCGLDPRLPLRLDIELLETEKAECENLLQAVIFNWPVLKNVTVPGLRSMFLMREGMISARDGNWLLRVADQAYDILLDQMPWGISTVKLPWMQELLFVEWRL